MPRLAGTTLAFWTACMLTAASPPPARAEDGNGAAKPSAAEKRKKASVAEKKGEGKNLPENPFPGRRPKAPPLEGGVGWLNAAGPIELSKLKGKIVLLDFWTYCCINCMHVLPDLAKLEKEFPNELVVVGVHSAKFTGEKNTDNIREAILRYGIRHPVVNDGKMAIWQSYGVRSWPTLVLIDPEGHVVGGLSGEGHYQTLRDAIGKLVAYYRAKGTLDEKPIHFQLEALGTADTPLRFPGKLHADPAKNRIFISDSSHHRIVVAELSSGKTLQVIGEGTPGLQDGPIDKAQFNDPQGLALSGEFLYVADTKNHVIRLVDLAARQVSTIAGTGKQGYERQRTAPARDIPMSSPWDLLLKDDALYIAMAGDHQIWKLDLKKNTAGAYAGDGRESINDGERADAQFSQPSGLTADRNSLYVADSEISAVRKIDLEKGLVTTLVGKGLFDFGDVDGDQKKARLQHALAVAYHDGVVYVADTYNNKIKGINLRQRSVKTLWGDGKPGSTDDPPRFDEPAGLHIAGDEMYVADTNNHKIRVIHLPSKKVRTLEITGLEPPKSSDQEPPTADARNRELPAVVLRAKDAATFKGAVQVPTGAKLNPKAPMSYRLEKLDAAGKAETIARGKISPPAAEFAVDAKGLSLADAKTLRLTVVSYPCEQGSEGVCRVQTDVWTMPVSIDPQKGVATVELTR